MCNLLLTTTDYGKGKAQWGGQYFTMKILPQTSKCKFLAQQSSVEAVFVYSASYCQMEK